MEKLPDYSPIKTRYYRRLPHWQRENAAYFITFRLANSLPKSVIAHLMDERTLKKAEYMEKGLSKKETNILIARLNHIYFMKYDKLLEGAKGPHYLKDKRLTKIVANAIMHFDQKKYEVINYCIMSNHVHLIIHQLQKEIDIILGSIKKFSAREINIELDKTGKQFWHYENFDHIIRGERSLKDYIQYNLLNPVEANLITDWRSWKGNYLHENFKQYAPT